MSHRRLLGAAGTSAAVPPRGEPVFTVETEVARPYAFPTSAPYHVPTYCPTPTPDGQGQAIHPSVVDIVAETGSTWRGYRYWMAMTPYTVGSGEEVEDPCILVSNGGYDWHVPPPLVNPLDHPTAPGDFNSDTELVYDPVTKKLVCYWRRAGGDFHAATSTDGVTWVKHGIVFPSIGTLETLSPCICRVGPGQWVMFMNHYVFGPETSTFRKYTATNPLGPWTYAGQGSVTPPPDANSTWHFAVEHDGTKFRALCSGRGTGTTYTASSADGLTWTTGPIVLPINTGWSTQPYRAAIVFEGTYAHVWYSAFSGSPDPGNRTGYTRIPKSEWPA